MSNFGQLMSVINLVNQVGYAVGQGVIGTQRVKGDVKLEKLREQHRKELETGELSFREKELALKVQSATRQDQLYKNIAIYTGIGITLVIGIITVSAVYFSKKEKGKRK